MEVKKPTTYDEQLALLRARECIVESEMQCLETLSQVSYYRLSAYFLPFKGPCDTYQCGTSFERVCRLYEFDRRMRGVLFTAIETLEIYLRTQLAYYHAHHYGALGYLYPDNFHDRDRHNDFLDKCGQMVIDNKKLLFVQHHIDKYEGYFPIWVLIELFTFGDLSFFYKNMVLKDRKEIALKSFELNYQNVESFLRCCTDMRNICAHYGRLYYRIFSAQPRTPLNYPFPLHNRLFDEIIALMLMYPSKDRWNTEIFPQIQQMIDEFSESIDLSHIGFPVKWAVYLRKT